MRRRAVALLLVLFGVLWAVRAGAEERRYALIIGYNGAPAGAGAEGPSPLRFADDDAFAFYELRLESSDQATLLSSPDDDTRRRYPDSVDAAQLPTLASVDRAMARFESAMQADRRAGRTSVFFFFYSGHGIRSADGEPALALLDGPLSRRALYEHVLDRAPADVVHLLVDACHAESMVEARDADAQAVPLTPNDVAAYVSQTVIAPYPHVGLAIASTREGVSHEWDVYQSGIFTHEVISALRGAADVNGDRRIEYSELEAFLAAANREVKDPRARLHAVIHAPATAPRSPLADLSLGNKVGRLTKIPAASDSFSIEDEHGNRLVDGRPELGFSISISLPANRKLFIRRGDQEADLILQPGVETAFGALTFRERPLGARGALESSLRYGLFLTSFGPAYYRGYVDRQDTVAVPMASSLDSPAEPRVEGNRFGRKSAVRSWLGGGSAALLVSSGVFAGMAWSAWHDNENAVERDSVNAASRFRLDTGLAAGFLISGVACATAAFLIGDP